MSVIRKFLKLSVFFTLCFALSQEIEATVGVWTTPLNIETVSTGSVIGSSQPIAISVNSAGNAVATWKRLGCGYSFFNGTSWTTPGTIQPDSTEVNGCGCGLSDLSPQSSIISFSLRNSNLPVACGAVGTGTTFGSDVQLDAPNSSLAQTPNLQCMMSLPGKSVSAWYHNTTGSNQGMMALITPPGGTLIPGNAVSIFSSPGTNLATGAFRYLSVSPNTGNSSIAWVYNTGTSSSTVQVALNVNGSWFPATIVSSVGNFGTASTAINDAGQAVVAWIDLATSFPWVSVYNGSSWSSPVQVASTTVTNGTVVTGIDKYGNGVVGFTSLASVGTLASFTLSGSVGTPVAVTGSPAFRMNLAMNPNGQAVAVWVLNNNTPTAKIQAAYYQNGTITNYPDLYDFPSNLTSTGFTPWVDVNASGFAMATWRYTDGTNYYGYSSSIQLPSLVPNPVSNLVGSVSLNNFGTVIDRVKILTWSPSPTSGVTSYNIYQNGSLIGNVLSSSQLIFYVHDTTKAPQTFAVTALSINGESTPSAITF